MRWVAPTVNGVCRLDKPRGERFHEDVALCDHGAMTLCREDHGA